MARSMINSLRDLNLDIDIVIPVPLAYKRLFKRGYNQATLLARPIAKYFDATIDVDSISRKYRPDMGHKTAAARAKNIRGVFTVVHPDKIRGKHILLIGDVMTPGATFAELYKVLKKAGAASVAGVSFCRVVRTI
jgi:ComF family protein